MFVILNTMNDEEYVFAKNLIFGELEYSYIPSSYCFPTVYKNEKKAMIGQSRVQKNGFSQFLPNLSILEYMLLHNTNINVAIAHILVCRNSLYDLQGQSYKNQ